MVYVICKKPQRETDPQSNKVVRFPDGGSWWSLESKSVKYHCVGSRDRKGRKEEKVDVRLRLMEN